VARLGNTTPSATWCNSFAYATVVATPTGAKPIGSLKVGEPVLAYDGASGKVQAEPVQHVLIHHDTNLLDVTLSMATTLPKVSQPGQDASARKQQQAAVAAHGSQAPPTSETIHTTTEHPFLTQELGWVDASDLKPGEHMRRADGSLGVVVGVQVVAGEAVRYNLTVAHDHTFLVGADQWVVHNTCGGGSLDDAANARAQELASAIGAESGTRNARFVTVAVGYLQDTAGTIRKVVALNEDAWSLWRRKVEGFLQAGEELLPQTRYRMAYHAEQYIVDEAGRTGSILEGIGASNGICEETCGPIIRGFRGII
jgi:hypothetical protein